MTRATRAVIHLSALRHNLSIAHQYAPDAKQMAIIKANAYGHGLTQVAQALHQADAFGVATLDEAIHLREAGNQQPIVLLEGIVRAADLNLVRGYRLELVIHQQQQVQMLEQQGGDPIPVWLKVDSGMHRLGVKPDSVMDLYQRLQACANPVRLMTHLASADERQNEATTAQLAIFDPLAQALQVETSIANSAGILAWPASHANWVRPGIMLYGVSPFAGSNSKDHNLQAVMTLQSELIAVNTHRKGERIGYGGDWPCPQTMPVGVVAIGYGDGYPRHIKDNTPVLIKEKRVPIIGRISMDMLCVDLRDCAEATIGDTVTLWGEGILVEEIAAQAGTIAYELLCQVTGRVKYEIRD